MGKFKVGDRVVGNEKANRYGITVEGWEGTVIRVGNGYISVNGPGSCGGDGFSVDPDCFDMLQPAPNSHLDEHISIFARKNRIVATITKGEQKFTQSISLHKANGDFKAAVKMVVEKLLDKFEAREQSHFTASTIDWESFKAGKFAVHCDTEEKAEAFLKECDEHGIKWANGKSLLIENKWKDHKTETLYGFDGGVGLYYGTAWGFNNKPSIDYTPSKPTVKDVFRKAKVRDKIKVVRIAGNHTPEIKIGDIHTITSITSWSVHTDKRNAFRDTDEEYIIIEEAPEEIQIGDTVKVVNYGHTCDTYRDFIKKYAKGFYHKYAHGYTPNNGDIGVVVGKGKHERYINKDYYTVLANDKVFCISEEGIEKIKQEGGKSE